MSSIKLLFAVLSIAVTSLLTAQDEFLGTFVGKGNSIDGPTEIYDIGINGNDSVADVQLALQHISGISGGDHEGRFDGIQIGGQVTFDPPADIANIPGASIDQAANTFTIPGFDYDFFTIKSGNGFSLYQAGSGANHEYKDLFKVKTNKKGETTTTYHDISHISFFAVVPETSTIALSGLALFCLGYTSYKRRTKAYPTA